MNDYIRTAIYLTLISSSLSGNNCAKSCHAPIEKIKPLKDFKKKFKVGGKPIFKEVHEQVWRELKHKPKFKSVETPKWEKPIFKSVETPNWDGY